ncbi:MAG: hypothetical protein EPN69_17170 [Rhodanobacter sp.]|nr:MAG: hypothetical protein EPN69_17170 [Rhodanobacter sp.]TAM39429.1 MAG: hypothetical protein EPN58_13925 [Rhodanobacter sp.]TAN26942.1 MAG: hypothetical protein EPN32_05295 [Rhodanobacter sp.]
MKLLRDSLLLRTLRRLLAGRRNVVRHYTVTVPAPLDRSALDRSAASNVIELHRRTAAVARRASMRASTHAAPAFLAANH